jgi:hypothetical protein
MVAWLNKLLVLAVCACWIKPASGDSCSFIWNRLHLGTDLVDPLFMIWPPAHQKIRCGELIAKFNLSTKFDLLASAGYYRQQGVPAESGSEVYGKYQTIGVLYKLGDAPDIATVHIEVGPLYSHATSAITLYTAFSDVYNGRYVGEESYTNETSALYLETALVLRASNRFRFRFSADLGRVISNRFDIPPYTVAIPGTGSIASSSLLCARGGISFFVNVFAREDGNGIPVSHRPKRKAEEHPQPIPQFR